MLRKDGHISLQHIHCYEEGNPGFQNQVRFRGYLNVHPEFARQYDELKRDLAARYPYDRGKYTEGIERFIQTVHKLANSR